MNSKSRGSEYIMETILSSVQDDDDVGELSESLGLRPQRLSWPESDADGSNASLFLADLVKELT